MATRAQLISAAADLFAERGTTNITVEAVCERAGFTRGAFYSNFKTVDDVFFALYEQRTSEIEGQLESLADEARTWDNDSGWTSVEATTARALHALPADGPWYAIRAGFIGQAYHRPAIAVALRQHAERFAERLQPLLLLALERSGRRLRVDPATFTRAVIAAHVGAVSQTLLYDDPQAVREAAVHGVVAGLSEPT